MTARHWQRTGCTLLTALLLAFIFGNSAAGGEDSSSLSLRVTEWLNAMLHSAGSGLELSHALVRKLAHFAEYSLLGAVLVLLVRSWQEDGAAWRFRLVFAALAGGLCTACLDEFLQVFVPGRHGCIADVLLDFSAVTWAAAAVAAVLVFTGRRKDSRHCSSD